MNRADDITRMQCHVGQFLADARERANDERMAHLPAGSLRPAEIIEGPSDQDIIELIAVTYDMNPVDALDRLASIDFDAARVRNEVAA